ncbi:MAG: AraC family transcriptional regulator [Propionibacteriaceae bacterium]|nr:AraC family transcriptional regulator [Propionibacteriaceae bacterium]
MSLDGVGAAAQLPDLVGLLDSCPVDGFQADFVSWGFYSPTFWRNYWHSHSFYEVCLAYSGAGRFSCGEQHYHVGRGDLFLARPGVVHEIEAEPDSPLGIAFWGFTLKPVNSGSLPTEPGWWSGLGRGPVVSDRIGNVPAVLSSLSGEVRHPRSGFVELCKALGAALVIDTARAFTAEEDLAVPPRRRDRGSQVVAAMHRHLADNLSRPTFVRDVAAAVHLSERHAERLFTEQTGESLMSTLRRLRLELAGQLLLETTQPTREIARACGYADITAFRSAFRRHYGQPPQTFRANNGTLHLPTVP